MRPFHRLTILLFILFFNITGLLYAQEPRKTEGVDNDANAPTASADIMNPAAKNRPGIDMNRPWLSMNMGKVRNQTILDSLSRVLKKYEDEDKGNAIEATAVRMKIGLYYADINKKWDALPYLIKSFNSLDEISRGNLFKKAFSTSGSLYGQTSDDNTKGAENDNAVNSLTNEDLKKGIDYLIIGQSLYRDRNMQDEAAGVNEVLSKAYQLTGNYKLAFEAQEKCRLYKDSLYIRDKAEKTARIEETEKELAINALKYEYEKKQAAAKSEKEKQELKYEEELKRNQINFEYAQKKAALEAARKREVLIAKARQQKRDAAATLKLQRQRILTYSAFTGLLLLLGFAWYIVRNNKLLANEKNKSESLLLNILPSEIAYELKERGATTAKHFDSVSVLFTDFVAFTKAGERMGSQQLVEELHTCFKAFDEITSKYHIEKIKTIGDAYLAVCGLPLSDNLHAENTVRAAMDILAYMTERKERLGDQTFEIRIGVHSGDVVAGIVGVKKFAYDIWGDTVNTAARMEQNSKPGKINISESTYELVKDKFNCAYRGEIEAKNKGMLKMYFVES